MVPMPTMVPGPCTHTHTPQTFKQRWVAQRLASRTGCHQSHMLQCAMGLALLRAASRPAHEHALRVAGGAQQLQELIRPVHQVLVGLRQLPQDLALDCGGWGA